MDGQNTLFTRSCVLLVFDFETSSVRSRNQFKYFTEKLLLLKNLATSEGEPFLTKFFFTTNSSPLLVTKYVNNYFGVITNSVQCL